VSLRRAQRRSNLLRDCFALKSRARNDTKGIMTPTRFDHTIIIDLVEPQSKVLDLGCGDGTLMSLLIDKKQCRVTGLEINEKAVFECLKKGLTVSQADFDTSLADFSDGRFDYVILNESLQQVLHPKNVILEALRVGKKAIIGIPNFCHMQARLQIFFGGKVPVTSKLPYQWYDTPNLRFLALKDFHRFCKDNRIKILKEVGITESSVVGFRPNLFANIGVYLLSK